MKKALMQKVINCGNLKLFSFLFSLLIGMVSFCGIVFLAAKIYDLNWENYFLNNKVYNNEHVINLLLEERAFEKEMKENLSAYLPEGYHSVATFLNLSPLDFDSGKARINFLYQGRTYFIDFSYYKTFYGWHVDADSPITLKL